MSKEGWTCTLESRLVSELGDAPAQRRTWALAWRRGELPSEGWLTRVGVVQVIGAPMAQYLDAAKGVPGAEWQEGALCLDPRASMTRDSSPSKSNPERERSCRSVGGVVRLEAVVTGALIFAATGR